MLSFVFLQLFYISFITLYVLNRYRYLNVSFMQELGPNVKPDLSEN